MKPQFQHESVTSFAMWLEHHILQNGQAFSTKNDQELFYQEDDRLDEGWMAFASPHKQWVTDSSITNAKVADSIYHKATPASSPTTLTRVGHNIQFDYDNGRALLSKVVRNHLNLNEDSLISIPSYSVKDFNIYITDQTEEELLLESQFDTNSRFSQEVTEGIKPYDQVVPAIFISYESSSNEPFAFGGEDTTRTNIRCVIFSESSYQLDGLFSILNDTNNLNITNVGFNEHPLNEVGDIKGQKYSYEDLVERYFDYRSISIIDKVRVSKLNDRVAKKTHPGLFLGFADFELISMRFPRQEYVSPVPSEIAVGKAPTPAFNLGYSPVCGAGGGDLNLYYEFNHMQSGESAAKGYSFSIHGVKMDWDEPKLCQTLDVTLGKYVYSYGECSEEQLAGGLSQTTPYIIDFNKHNLQLGARVTDTPNLGYADISSINVGNSEYSNPITGLSTVTGILNLNGMALVSNNTGKWFKLYVNAYNDYGKTTDVGPRTSGVHFAYSGTYC